MTMCDSENMLFISKWKAHRTLRWLIANWLRLSVVWCSGLTDEQEYERVNHSNSIIRVVVRSLIRYVQLIRESIWLKIYERRIHLLVAISVRCVIIIALIRSSKKVPTSDFLFRNVCGEGKHNSLQQLRFLWLSIGCFNSLLFAYLLPFIHSTAVG